MSVHVIHQFEVEDFWVNSTTDPQEVVIDAFYTAPDGYRRNVHTHVPLPPSGIVPVRVGDRISITVYRPDPQPWIPPDDMPSRAEEQRDRLRGPR